MSDANASKQKNSALGQAAMAVGLVAAVLTLILCALLTATHLQLKRADPLNNDTLVSLLERYEGGERDDQTKSDIRQLDLLARKAFFVSQSQIRTGGLAAVLSAVVMLLAFGIYQAATKNIPPPTEDSCEGMFWINVERSRVWIAGGTIILVAVSIVMTVSTPTSLTPDLATAPTTDNPTDPTDAHAPLSPQHISPTSSAPVYPADFAAHSPIFRGPASSGHTDFEDVPTEWDETAKKNLLWKIPLDLFAWASPIVWEDKVITLGADAEERVVYCVDAATGKDVWTTTVPEHKDATKDYKTNTQDERWDAMVYAGGTPAVNGKQVFALFSNGQLLALNLEDGEVLWDIVPAQTSTNTYGLDCALLIYKDSVIVVFTGNENFIARYDAATGKELWKMKRESPTWASPLLAKRADGQHMVIVLDDPNVTAWDPETGEKLWRTKVLIESPEFCVGPSPIQVGDRVFVNCQNSGIYGLELADGKQAWALEKLPDDGPFPDGISMTTDGKHIYQFYHSSLTCIDPATGNVVKQKEMDETSNYASPALNKGNLYLFGDGVALIVNADPATDFATIGKGAMEESIDSCPAIVNGRIYMRADASLYCFGTK